MHLQVHRNTAKYLNNLDKLVFTELTDGLVLEVLHCVAAVSFVNLLQTDIRSVTSDQ